MLDLSAMAAAFMAIAAFAMIGWLASVIRRDVSIVDSLWALFFLLGVATYTARAELLDNPRAQLVLGLVGIWALRLSVYLTWRNWDEPEDRRYAAMRAARGSAFVWQSAYVVFLLQAVLAAIISLPLLAAVSSSTPLGALDVLGAALWAAGFLFETVGDWQLARFKAAPANVRRVLDHGLWRYTRHPNYFGEATLWWGYFLLAVAAGAAWTVFSPLLMTLLLLKVSGVSLLERDIGERRPAYREYVARTNAFLPWFPRAS
jgi:steroid 5-alpha reductase family enzyme